MQSATAVSNKGALALMAEEGLVPAPYYDSVYVLTFGVGHTAAAGAPDPHNMPMAFPVGKDLELAIVKAVNVFLSDLEKYTAEVLDAIKVPLLQSELDALVSFHYNTGGIRRAKLTQYINSIDRTDSKWVGAISRGFDGWHKPPEIIDRRNREKHLFLTGEYLSTKVAVYATDGRGNVMWRAVPPSINGQSASEYVKRVLHLEGLGKGVPQTPSRKEDDKSLVQMLIDALVGIFRRNK